MKYIIVVILILGTRQYALAQMEGDLSRLYKEKIPLFQDVVTGGQYIDPPFDIEGHPFFDTRNFSNGTITLNGLYYAEIPLQYNIWKDEIITFHPVHKQKTLVNIEKVNSFTLTTSVGRIDFVRWDLNSGYAFHRNGFYQKLVAGNANLFLKHYKISNPKRETGKYSSEFIGKIDFFIEKSGEIFPINRKKQAIECLDVDKRWLKGQSKLRGLNFKTDPINFLSFLTTTYNSSQP